MARKQFSCLVIVLSTILQASAVPKQAVEFASSTILSYQATINERFAVRLSACVGCGYVWEADNVTRGINITGPRYEGLPDEPVRGGTQVAVFDVLPTEASKSDVRFVYWRPWDTEAGKVYVLRLTVTDAGSLEGSAKGSPESVEDTSIPAVSSSNTNVSGPAATVSLRGSLLGADSLLPAGLLNRGWFPQGCSGLLCNGNCPITANPTNDGGCCGAGSIGVGQKRCVVISPANMLKYACGLPADVASEAPQCRDRARWWMFWSNKAINERCTLGGESCTYIKYGWFTRKINLFGGNRQDKLTCTCPGVFTYRRSEDGPWTLGR